MAVADVCVKQITGAGPTETEVTTPRLSTSDSAAPGNANPIPIAAAGLSYSYWMSLELVITNIQDATVLNNHLFYSDGTIGWALGTGGKLVIGLHDAGDNGTAIGSYDQATGDEGVSGDFMEDDVDGHASYKDQDPETGLVSAYETGGTELLVDSGDHTIAEQFKHIVIQAVVDDDAVRGARAAETLTFQYDEV